MTEITIKDKTFVISIPSSRIQSLIDEMAANIAQDVGQERPVFLCVLKGAFLLAADLFKRMDFDCEVSFIRLASYAGTSSTGTVKNMMGFSDNLKNRTVVVIEDIVDTGDTVVYLLDELKKQEPARILLASLLLKPDALRNPVKLDYVGFEVPNDFLVGYGLDYDGIGRNLNDIYKLK
jgi:hypoxanthine phosphoribosyltransferase